MIGYNLPHRNKRRPMCRELLKDIVGNDVLYSQDIKQTIQHRYPFLLVDQVLEIEEGKRVVGLKNVTINEPFFQGHFPDYPVMPGVLIVEALAQVGAISVLGMEANKDK